MLNDPTNRLSEGGTLDVDEDYSDAQIGGDWRIGDAPLRWDVSLTDRIQAALRQCVSRRLILGHTLHHRRVA